MIEINDVLILIGLASIGAGLFFLYGSPVSLSVLGGILLLMGLFGRSQRNDIPDNASESAKNTQSE